MTRKTRQARYPRIALDIPWPACPSGHAEYKLIGWSEADAAGQRLPIFEDDAGEQGGWASGYAIQQPDGCWRFPDGETCNDAGLAAAFIRRKANQ